MIFDCRLPIAGLGFEIQFRLKEKFAARTSLRCIEKDWIKLAIGNRQSTFEQFDLTWMEPLLNEKRYLAVVRRSLALLLIALASVAQADHVITVPRGGKIPFGVLRGEYMFEPGRPANSLSYIGFGVTTFIDAEIQIDDLRNDEHFSTLNLGFNINAPLAGIAPGISFGIQDASNVSEQGRRAYMAVSFQDPTSNNAAPVETTLGAFVGRRSCAFVGVSLPVDDRFRFLAEDDGQIISAGAEYKPVNGTFFRLVFRNSSTLLSIGASRKF